MPTDADPAAEPAADPAAAAITVTIAKGYAFTGPALELGCLLWDGARHPDSPVRIPLVAGATGTGTGKTKTLQLIAEQPSAPPRSAGRGPRPPSPPSSTPSAAWAPASPCGRR